MLAILSDPRDVPGVVSLAMSFARDQSQTLTVLCWTESLTVKYPLLIEDEDVIRNAELFECAEQFVKEVAATDFEGVGPPDVEIKRAIEPDIVTATLAEIRVGEHEIAVMASDDANGTTGADYGTNELLRRSPCMTLVLYRERTLVRTGRRVVITSVDSPHDVAAFRLFADVADTTSSIIELARLEDESGAEAIELGRRELSRLMRDAGVEFGPKTKYEVFPIDSMGAFFAAAEQSDLVMVGANQQELVKQLHSRTTKPAIVVIKREPPLKRFGRAPSSKWRTSLSPADYADMMQGLRRGAELNADFLIMLGLAAAIASFGLLQDSPAVVIGSMLLAPLMTPMISCGLAIAQGNKKLGRRSMNSIAWGFLLTLVVSYLVGLFASGEEITEQIVSRGNPNSLDLLIALLSAAAAAYALARPNIGGAVAGVAIATALVPPLCSTGISLAYREYLNAHGAALLFATNLVAIVLGAAVTFRLLGVKFTGATVAQRQWVYRIATVICLALIVLAYPLHRRLDAKIEQGTSQPTNYPLTKSVEHALVEFISQSPEIELVASGRPSALYERADVVLVLSSPELLPRSYADSLIEICRREMDDPELTVEVHCLRDAWADEPSEATDDAETERESATTEGSGDIDEPDGAADPSL